MIYHRLLAQVIRCLLLRKTVNTVIIVAPPVEVIVPLDIIVRHHPPPTLHRLRLLRTTTGRRNLDALDAPDAPDVLVAPSMTHQVTALVLVPVLVLVLVRVPALAITLSGIPVRLQAPLLRLPAVIEEEDLGGRRRGKRGRS